MVPFSNTDGFTGYTAGVVDVNEYIDANVRMLVYERRLKGYSDVGLRDLDDGAIAPGHLSPEIAHVVSTGL
jgi:hypothetical protein